MSVVPLDLSEHLVKARDAGAIASGSAQALMGNVDTEVALTAAVKNAEMILRTAAVIQGEFELLAAS